VWCTINEPNIYATHAYVLGKWSPGEKDLLKVIRWVEGWTTPFGLIALDPATQGRTPRRSAELYAEVVRANAITEEMVEKYAPQVVNQVFAEPV
jgi:beta-glucosidase/6-phospho-beta-glucosidase/beta-galactosidase